MSPERAFGEKLRLAREGSGLSLKAIAQGTKIASLLASLERGDCSRWPGGVYSRGYVRSYAQAVGLDPKAISEEFCERFPTVAWPDGPDSPTPTGCLPLASPDPWQYCRGRGAFGSRSIRCRANAGNC